MGIREHYACISAQGCTDLSALTVIKAVNQVFHEIHFQSAQQNISNKKKRKKKKGVNSEGCWLEHLSSPPAWKIMVSLDLSP